MKKLALLLLLFIPLISFASFDLDGEISRFAVKYHQDAKLAARILYCESRRDNSAINLSSAVGEDVGFFQINTYWHQKTAEAMGLDIYSPEDNLEYGFYLMSKEGTQPWNASKKCWGDVFLAEK